MTAGGNRGLKPLGAPPSLLLKAAPGNTPDWQERHTRLVAAVAEWDARPRDQARCCIERLVCSVAPACGIITRSLVGTQVSRDTCHTLSRVSYIYESPHKDMRTADYKRGSAEHSSMHCRHSRWQCMAMG